MLDTLIDLTHPLADSAVPLYPGDPTFTCRPRATVLKDGYSVHDISLCSHTGTHIDAPSHFIADGKTIDQIPLSALTGPAVVVDLTQKQLKERQMIEWDDIQEYAPQMRDGVILLLYTGWSQYWGLPKYYEHPYLSYEAAKRILESGVRVLGVDMLNPDETPFNGVDSTHGFGVHQEILGAGGVIAENLTNLQALGDGQSIVALIPLNLVGCDGSPIRALAWRESNQVGV
ncbi:putative cyclase [Tricholoma matsutake]|nr:putative cyclase [Tricholoma matsutake 945]